MSSTTIGLSSEIGFKEKIGYAFGDFASNLVFMTVGTYLMFFYTDIFGISPMAAGTLFLAARIWDAINDPIMGTIADKTRTRWGSYRPWILWMAVPFAIFAMLCFTTPQVSNTGKLVWAYITYIGLGMIYTAVNIPYGVMTAVMTNDMQERTVLTSWRMYGAITGIIIVIAFTQKFVDWIGGGDPQKGYQFTMLIFGILGAVLFILCFAWTKERLEPPKRQKLGLIKTMSIFKGNVPWICMLLIFFFMYLITTIRMGFGMYYFTYYIGRQDLFPVYLMLYFVPQFALMWAMPLVVKKLGKRNALILGNVIMILTGILLFIARQNIFLVLASSLIGGAVGVLGSPVIWAMVPDTVEYTEWKSGIRAPGLIYSATSFSMKLAQGIAGSLTGIILTIIAYNPGVAEQTEQTLQGIYFWNAMFSILVGLTCTIVALFYKLDSKTFEKIKVDLAERNKA